MIPRRTKQWLFRLIPNAYDYRFTSPSTGEDRIGRARIEKRWAAQDNEPDHPMLILDHGPTGVLRAGEQPISSVFERREIVDAETALEELHKRRVYDEFAVTFTEQGTHPPTGTNADQRMNDYASTFYPWFCFEFPRLVRSGGSDPEEIPLTIRQSDISALTDTSIEVDDQYTQRRSFTFRVSYSLQWLVEVDRVLGMRAIMDETDLPGRTQLEVVLDPATDEVSSSTESLPDAE